MNNNPIEENMEERHTEKTKKYQALTWNLSQEEKPAKLLCVEVGSRGLPAKSLHPMSKWLQHDTAEAAHFRTTLGRRAITCSHVIWQVRSHAWEPPKTE